MSGVEKVLGHWAACPLCDEHGERRPKIKADRNGNPFLWCVNPHCNVQIFTQGKGDRAKHMLAKMTPIATTGAPGDAGAPEKPAPAPTSTTAAPSDAKRRVFKTLLES